MRFLFGRVTEKHFLLENDHKNSSLSGCDCRAIFSVCHIYYIFSFSSNASTAFPNVTPTTKPESLVFQANQIKLPSKFDWPANLVNLFNIFLVALTWQQSLLPYEFVYVPNEVLMKFICSYSELQNWHGFLSQEQTLKETEKALPTCLIPGR